MAGMIAERGGSLGLKEEERRTCSRGSRKSARWTTGGKGRERGTRQCELGLRGLGVHLTPAMDLSWVMGQSLPLSCLFSPL